MSTATPSRPLRAATAHLRLLAASLLIGLGTATPATAGEGGSSHYMPGTVGDFAMALIGPHGFYLRNDVVFFQGNINSVTLGGRIYSSADQDVWVNTVKAIYLAEGGILGGRFGAVVSVPIVLNASVSGELVSPFKDQASGSRSGFSDIAVTSFLNWSSGDHHYSAGLSVYVPVGSYEEGRIINLGRNYWSFDPIVTYTWLDPKRGHEVSVTTGIMFNTTNDATGYSSGTEWHLDFMLSQHFSADFAVGLEGSVLRGLTDDSGSLLNKANTVLPVLGLKPLDGFRARYFGLGPAVVYSPTIAGKDVNIIAKYLFDVTHENRFNSDYLVVSFALML
jgi:hypothetical protein